MAPKLATVVQYVFLAIVLYVIAGAPLQRMLFNTRPPVLVQELTLEKLDSLVIPDETLVCPEHSYDARILSRDPLVVYMPSFLAAEEAQHLVDISEDKFNPSTIWNGDEETLDESVRVSEKAQLDRDNVVQCIEERARAFQGWRPYTFIEKLWSQRYRAGGHYVHHYDWASSAGRAGRISSFMVYLDANCTGGGTNFPRLNMPSDKKWCSYLDCDDSEHEGVTFKPIAGNAIYWENFGPDGSGYEECWHAGLPVLSGTKIGLNIWSWHQPGFEPASKAVPTTAERAERAEL
ncbi:oxidoreductase [Saccharata proteae CBS 121410]|uniref:Oxidoreductase n=1 Tax=Saccharata proteae CBS 121410 TaxID=1314787 RepID=A0A9P4I4D9_9PEZI|nr:oxidoreductase [Saccharata proteae CBS 121410]